MNRFFVFALSSLLALGSVGSMGCGGGGTGDESPEPEASLTPEPITIKGDWISAGDDVSDLLAYFKIVKIESTFNGDGTYTSISTSDDGTQVNLAGTYQLTESAVEGIMNITLVQSIPSAVTAVGIYQIDENSDPISMQYEVAQTEPPADGVTPPTAAGGFGSTSAGAYSTTNIQVYKRK